MEVRAMEKKKIIKEIKSLIFLILGAFFIATLISSEAVAKVKVQQSSMENTLYNNQQLIVDKLSYNFTDPKREDIIIFLGNEKKGTIVDEVLLNIDKIVSMFNNDKYIEKYRLVKRVIGVAGDEIDIVDGYVYLNGKKLEEPYAKGETFCGEFKLPVTVSENKLFVLGDNRSVSKDSRIFGLIDCDQVEGKAIYNQYFRQA
jgi:signal peptidase I